MGSCMSKSKQKRKLKEENCDAHVDDDDDKLIAYSQASTYPSPLLANIGVALSPSKSPASITSLSSSISCPSSEFSMTSSLSSLSSSSSSSSWSSSVLSSRERSFSNEFLRSCAKENSHILGLDPIRESFEKHPSMSMKKIQTQKIQSSPSRHVMQRQQSINQERVACSTQKKRARNTSPMAVRQKSLRRDHLERVMRSPSPSRRFNTDSPKRVLTNATKETVHHHYKASTASSKVNNGGYGNASGNVKKEFIKPISNADYDLRRRRMEMSIQQIDDDAAMVETSVGEMQQAKKDIDSILMEDITNPHVALDCFIFL